MSETKIKIEVIEVGRDYRIQHDTYGTVIGKCVNKAPVRWFTLKLQQPNKKLAESFKKVGDNVSIDIIHVSSVDYETKQLGIEDEA